MIPRLPNPWFDPIVSMLSSYNFEFRKHYLKEIKLQPQTFVCCDMMNSNIIHAHHIIPIAELGSNSASNLIYLCQSCHKKAESGLMQLPKNGKYYGRGIKKKNKLWHKWLNDIDYLPEIIPTKLFIMKHIIIDSVIKQLIQSRDTERLVNLTEDWCHEGLLNKPLELTYQHE